MLLSALLLSFALMFTLISCGNKQNEVEDEETENGGSTEKDEEEDVTQSHEHTPADPITENKIDETCTDNGGYDAVVYCTECHEKLSSTSYTVPASGHQYKGYVCSVCNDVLATSEGLKFVSYGNGTCYVAGMGSCEDTDLIIPLTSPDGDEVISIYDNAFYDCDDLKRVVIGDSVTYISSAFSNCDNLTEVVIGDGVTSIGSYAFYKCTALKNVEMGKNVKSINTYAFGYCAKLESIVIPEGVTGLGEGAFEGCDSLATVVIPDSLTHIGSFAFAGCDNLESIVLGKGVTSIQDYAFKECGGIAKVYYKGTADEWAKVRIGQWLNNCLLDAKRYYYSEEMPLEEGDFWHYDTDGNIAVWS